MADFNWINAVPTREWSAPERGWSVLGVDRRDFARKSLLERHEDAGALFAEWAQQQIHRNYILLADELEESGGALVIAMRANPLVGSPRASKTPGRKKKP